MNYFVILSLISKNKFHFHKFLLKIIGNNFAPFSTIGFVYLNDIFYLKIFRIPTFAYKI